MDLSPEIIDAMRSQHDAMGFGFNPEALTQVRGLDMISLASAMGLPPEEIASLLIQKIAAAHIEHELPKCVRQLGDSTMISMPLNDLRFAYGYLALVEAGAHINLDQTKRAIKIALKLSATSSPPHRRQRKPVPK
jgi:hypothetical protein